MNEPIPGAIPVDVVKPAEKSVNPERTKVLTAFNFARTEFEAADEASLTPEQKSAKKGIAEAAKRTIDAARPRNRFRVNFENPNDSNKPFIEYEGIPVDELIDFLKSKVSDPATTDPKEIRYLEAAKILEEHSKSFFEIGNRMQPDKYVERVRTEAYYISQDERATRDPKQDFENAGRALTKRKELIIPKNTPSKWGNRQAYLGRVAQEGTPWENRQPATTPTSTESTDTTASIEASGTTAPLSAPEGDASEPPLTPPLTTQVEREFAAINSGSLELKMVNATEQIEKRAREMANEQLAAEMRRGSIFNLRDLFRKIKLRLGEEYYRQVYTTRARKAMLDNNTPFLQMDLTRDGARAVVNVDKARAEEAAKIEQIQKQTEAGIAVGGQEGFTEVEGKLRQLIIDEVITPLVQDPTADRTAIQKKLADFVINHPDDATIVAIFGKNNTQYGTQAEYFATNLEEIAAKIRVDHQAHGFALDQIDQIVRIKIANATWAAQTEGRFNWVDKTLAWAQGGSKRGFLINPATVGIAASLAAFPERTIVKMGLGAFSGGVFAALRRNRDLKTDMAMHRTERAYSKPIEPGSKRRGKLEEMHYDTASVSSLLTQSTERRTVNGDTRSLHELMTLDLSDPVNQDALVARYMEVVTRLDYSALAKIDLVTFASSESVEQGRLTLIKDVIRAKQAIKEAHMQGTDRPLQKDGESNEDFARRMSAFEAGVNDTIRGRETHWKGRWENQFIQNKDQQDKAFLYYRLGQAAIAGGFGGIAGFTGGLISQEAFATIGRTAGLHVGQTALEGALGIKSHDVISPTTIEVSPGTTTVISKPDIFQTGGSEKLADGFNLNVDPTTHNITILDASNHPVTGLPDLKFNPSNDTVSGIGNTPLPPDVKQALTNAHFTVLNETTNVTPGAISETPINADTLKQAGTPLAHRQWYSYDLPGSQGNELKLYDSYNAKTGVVTLDMSHMHLGYQTGLNPNPIDVQQAIANHETGFAISLPSTYSEPIWIPTDSRGLVQLDPNSMTHILTPGGKDTGLTMHDLYNILINKNAMPNGGTTNFSATEVNHLQSVFNLGDGKGDWGRIEAGRLVQNPNGSYNLQAFATIRGSGIPPTSIPTQAPTTVAYSFSIKPPVETSTIVTPPVVETITSTTYEAPFVVTAFAPRQPLEPLVEGGGWYYGYDVPISADTKTLFEKNRSKTLTVNPKARLNSYQETQGYFERQSPEYLETVRELTKQIKEPIYPNTALIICIPVAGHEEGNHIYNSLLNYTAQDAPKDTFEILLFVNNPQGTKPDKTLGEIDRFKKDHPDIPIRVIHREMQQTEATMAHIRKYLNDVALYRHNTLGADAGDVILVSNDADSVGVSPRYISNFINRFGEDPTKDGMLGQLDWDPQSYVEYPAVHVGTRLFQYLNLLYLRQNRGDFPSSGANFAFRGSIYAGIGGYQPNGTAGAEDVILGQAIRAARGGNTTLGYAGPGSSRVYTSSRRSIHAWEQRLAPAEQWDSGWRIINGEVRNLSLGTHQNINYDDPETLTKIKTELELVIDRTFRYYGGAGAMENDVFKQTAGWLGIQYRLNNDGKVEINDMSKLVKGLKEYQKIGVLLRDVKSGNASAQQRTELQNLLQTIEPAVSAPEDQPKNTTTPATPPNITTPAAEVQAPAQQPIQAETLEATVTQSTPENYRELDAQTFQQIRTRIEKSKHIRQDIRPGDGKPYSKTRTEEIRDLERRVSSREPIPENADQDMYLDGRGFQPQSYQINYKSPTGEILREQAVVFVKQGIDGQQEVMKNRQGQTIAINADLYESRLPSGIHAQGIEYDSYTIPRVGGRGAYTGIITLSVDKNQLSRTVSTPTGTQQPTQTESAFATKVRQIHDVTGGIGEGLTQGVRNYFWNNYVRPGMETTPVNEDAFTKALIEEVRARKITSETEWQALYAQANQLAGQGVTAGQLAARLRAIKTETLEATTPRPERALQKGVDVLKGSNKEPFKVGEPFERNGIKFVTLTSTIGNHTETDRFENIERALKTPSSNWTWSETASTATAPTNQPATTETLESAIPAPTPTTPEQATPKDLIGRIKETLTSTPEQTLHVEITPDEISEYLKTLHFPMGARIKEISTPPIINGALNTQGKISSPAGDITFSASLMSTPREGIRVDKFNVNLPFFARAMRGQIESQIQNLDTLISNQLNESVGPNWETASLQIIGDKIGIDFRKR